MIDLASERLRHFLLAGVGAVAGLGAWLLTSGDAPGIAARGAAVALASFAAHLAFTLSALRPLWSLAYSAGAAILSGAMVYWHLAETGSEGNEWRTLCLAVALFVALPIFQTLRDEGGMRTPYCRLHENSWGNVIVAIGGGLLFTIAVNALFALWAGLFNLIGVDLFARLFARPAFIAIVGGAAAATGVSLVREWDGVVTALQKAVMAVFGVLAPVLGFVLLLFLAFLPFTGISSLWQTTRYPTPLLLGAVVFALLLANAVVRNGNAEASKSLVSRYGAMALGLAMLPLSAIAALSVGVRIDAYGLMPERIWAIVFTGFAIAYGLAYAQPLMRRFDGWADSIRRSNVVIAIAICGIALLLSLPLVDFTAMSAANQRSRLMSGKVSVESFDFAALKFDLGKPGRKLLAELKAARGVRNAARIREAAAAADKLEDRWAERLSTDERQQRAARRRQALASVRIYPAGAVLPAGFVNAITTDPLLSQLEPMCGDDNTRRCAAIVADFSGDASADLMLLVEQCAGTGDAAKCWVTRIDLRAGPANRWLQGFEEPSAVDYDRLLDRLERGAVSIDTRTRQRLLIDGQPVQ
jgi:hypothetical protein